MALSEAGAAMAAAAKRVAMMVEVYMVMNLSGNGSLKV